MDDRDTCRQCDGDENALFVCGRCFDAVMRERAERDVEVQRLSRAIAEIASGSRVAELERKLTDARAAWSDEKLLNETLCAKLAIVATPTEGVWRWQGDGGDYPESLACPVVMSAETLRNLLTEVGLDWLTSEKAKP